MIKEKKELIDGFSYRFFGDDATIDLLIDFIKTERQCCEFFSFHLFVKDVETTWLYITGLEGSKNFIITELEL